jgi:hypothetical protein
MELPVQFFAQNFIMISLPVILYIDSNKLEEFDMENEIQEERNTLIVLTLISSALHLLVFCVKHENYRRSQD